MRLFSEWGRDWKGGLWNVTYSSVPESPIIVCSIMPVTVLCPACDGEVYADKSSGATQCPTCWAQVSLDAARRKKTDTPLPVLRNSALSEELLPAKRAAAETEGQKRPAQQSKPVPKGGGIIWTVASVVLVLAAGVGVVLFTLAQAPDQATKDASPAVPATKPADEPVLADTWTTVVLPEGATLFSPGPPNQQLVNVGDDRGVSHTATEGNTIAEVFVLDLKSERRADREEYLSTLLRVPSERITFRGIRPIPGGDALEFSASDENGFDHAGLVIGRGGRWFVFHTAWKPEDDPKQRRKITFLSRAGVVWLKPDAPIDAPKEPKKSVPGSAKPKDPKENR